MWSLGMPTVIDGAAYVNTAGAIWSAVLRGTREGGAGRLVVGMVITET